MYFVYIIYHQSASIKRITCLVSHVAEFGSFLESSLRRTLWRPGVFSIDYHSVPFSVIYVFCQMFSSFTFSLFLIYFSAGKRINLFIFCSSPFSDVSFCWLFEPIFGSDAGKSATDRRLKILGTSHSMNSRTAASEYSIARKFRDGHNQSRRVTTISSLY